MVEVNDIKIIEEITHSKEKQAKRIAKFEELKSKVSPKIALITKELADLEETLRNFEENKEDDGMHIFAKTLDFHLEGLKFEPERLIKGIEGEIALVQSDMEKLSLFSFDEIKNLKARGPYERREPNGLLTHETTVKLTE